MMGVAKNIMVAQPTILILTSNSSHCHPADGVYILLSDTICPSFIADVA